MPYQNTGWTPPLVHSEDDKLISIEFAKDDLTRNETNTVPEYGLLGIIT